MKTPFYKITIFVDMFIVYIFEFDYSFMEGVLKGVNDHDPLGKNKGHFSH